MRAAVLVPAPDYGESHDWAFDNQRSALESAGIEVVARVWTEPDAEHDADLLLPLTAWGYHQRFDEWIALLDRLERARVPVINPVRLLRWNSDKSYLAELATAGIPTVPTIALQTLEDADLAEARSRFGTTELVVKPPVSAGADSTFRLAVADSLPDAARGRRMLVQPFQRSITTQGELSLMMFNGVFSHALIKRAKTGDFRVQPHFGGREEQVEPPPEAIALAHAALAAAPELPVYARVDMIADETGVFQIMELELIEPALFLHRAPGSAERFGIAIAKAAEEILAKR